MAIPDECQGEADSWFYTPDLTRPTANVVPRPGPSGQAPHHLPMTVSQDDPVIIYILTPAVRGSVQWHLELDWLIGSRRGTTKVADDGRPFIASQH